MDLLLGQLAISNRTVLLLFGMALFAAGFLLMIQHRREWEQVRRFERVSRNLKFERKKFRRRALVGSLLSIVGAAMAALYWAYDSTVFVVMTLTMFLVLLLMLFLGVVDLIAVSLHEFSTVDPKARQEMVRKALELHEARQKQGLAQEHVPPGNGSSPSSPPPTENRTG